MFFILAACFAIGLYFFYLKYVPLVKPFQIILIPILFVVFTLTVIRVRGGTLFFIFSFPLINSLPYFFGIFEHIPHAPTALVLFLFYFLGWLVHNTLFKLELSFKHSIFQPMILFSIMIFFSGIITFLRYANFFPFISDHIYELMTNVHGVTAGGAIMSTLFFSLNYLTGFAFFFILLNTIDSKEFIKKILIVLLISTSLSLAVGFYQHFKDLSFGNTPLRVNEAIINSTFKTPLSFGAYLSLLIPVILAMAFAFKGVTRILSFMLFILVLFILPQTGSKSGLIGVFISLLLFLGFIIATHKGWKRLKSISLKKAFRFMAVSALIIAIVFAVLLSSKESEAYKRLTGLKVKYGGLREAIHIRWYNQWKMAAFMMKDYPLTGVGIGAYIIELPNYSEIHQGHYREWTDSAENYFFQVGSELGIFALFFSLWIFWEIFKKIKKCISQYFSRSRWKYIQIGISCGIISLFLNFFVHTYIGSYEIKYIFWLFVALIFSLLHAEKEIERKIQFRKNAKILSILLIVLFCAVHSWNSTHSLYLKNRSEHLGIKQNFGLYKKEKTEDGREFQWTRRYGGLTIRIEKPVIELPLLAAHPDIRRNPVKVKILIIKDFFKQKKLLDEITLREPGWSTFRYHIPEKVNEEVILLFKASRTWNPAKTLGTPDPRNLGVALGKIQFKDNKKGGN